MPCSVDERPLPVHCEPHFIGIKAYISFLGIANSNGPGPSAFDEVPVNDRFRCRHELLLSLDKSGGKVGESFLIQVSPDRRDLLFSVAGEHLLVHGYRFGPKGRHACSRPQAWRIEQIAPKPIPLQAAACACEIERWHAE